LQEILRPFCEVTKDDVKELRKCVEAADYKSAARQAHKIKDAAAYIGAEALRATAFEIEQSAQADNPKTVRALLENMDQELKVLERTLKEDDGSEMT